MARPSSFNLGGLLGGLMAEGYPGSPGSPIYRQNRLNPNQLDLSGWSGGMNSQRPARQFNNPVQDPYIGPPVNSVAAPSMPPSSFSKSTSIPALPGGGAGGYPGLPSDPYAPGGGLPPAPPPAPPGGPSAPPGGPSAPPSAPPGPPSPVDPNLGRNSWGGGLPGNYGYGPNGSGNYPGGNPNAGNSSSNSSPFQPGQTGWGWQGPNNYTPTFSPAAQAYIQNALYQNYGGVPAPWLSQVDPNNYLASIGQLSGVQFNPANWGG